MPPPSGTGLHWIDVSIIGAYLLLMVGIGYFFSRQKESLNEFIRGGSSIGWLPLGMSLMAALNSGLDYVQTPAATFGLGLVFITACLSSVILYPWVSRVTLPFYQRLDVYSAYEYLEYRFGVGLRLLGAGIFVLWRTGWMGAAIYVPCLAVRAATGDQIELSALVLILGTTVTIYTMLGGMRAVVWTDIAQFCIMFGGLATTLHVAVDQIPGGMTEVIRTAHDHGRLSIVGATIPSDGGLLSWLRGYFTTEVTLIGIVLMVTIGRAAAYTADQVAIQRFQSAKSLNAARRSYLVNAAADWVWMIALAFVGLALFAYHQHQPFPAGLQNDRILPLFINQHFAVGATGLIFAAIFAASLSSVDAALNSATSIITVDFYNRFWLGRVRPLAHPSPDDERRQLRVSRITTLCLGTIMIAIGSNIDQLGEIYQAGNKILGAFFGPLFAIFFLGMFSRHAHAAGVAIGAVFGLAGSCFASFFSAAAWLQALCGRWFGPDFVDFFKHLSWQWPPFIGVSLAIGVGYLASQLIPSGHARESALTFQEVMKRPPLANTTAIPHA